MANNNGQKQVSLAGAAGNPQKKKKQAKKFPVKLVVWLCVFALLGAGVWYVVSTANQKGPVLSAEEMVTYRVTPDSISGKVSYYALGVTGAEPTSRMDMIAVLCLDRKAKTASVVQIPVATYISKKNGFATNALGDVWAKPMQEQFCSTCRIKVGAEDLDGKKHTVCGSTAEWLPGSSSGDLIRVINTQYGLPIDNFVVIPREGLVELIDALDGIEVNLSKTTTLAGKSYDKGVQTLSGKAAVAYAITYNYKGTPASDRERMLRQRQVFAGLLQRFAEAKMDDLYKWNSRDEVATGVFADLMLGTAPIRFNTTSFGKARLLDVSDARAEDMKLSEAIARFAKDVSKIAADKFTFSILPGESAKSGSMTVYSVNKAQAITLLNAQMNPYGLVLDASTVNVPQLVQNPAKANLQTATMAQVKGEK